MWSEVGNTAGTLFSIFYISVVTSAVTPFVCCPECTKCRDFSEIVEMHLQSLSCCWWEGQGLLRTLPDNTSSQKRSFWENSPKLTNKNPPRESANSGSPIWRRWTNRSDCFGPPKIECPSPPQEALRFSLRRKKASVVTGKHWTGSPNKSMDQIGKSCPKNVPELCFQPLRTFFRHFRHFWHFSDILSTFPFSGLSNDLPVTRLAIATQFTSSFRERPSTLRFGRWRGRLRQNTRGDLRLGFLVLSGATPTPLMMLATPWSMIQPSYAGMTIVGTYSLWL